MSTVHCDPWRASIAHLLCAEPIPCPTTWPAARTRRVLAADDDRADGATGTSPAEREVLGLLGPRSMTPAELAEALDVRAGTLYTRTSRMQAKGLIVRVGAQWAAAAPVHAAAPATGGAPRIERSTARARGRGCCSELRSHTTPTKLEELLGAAPCDGFVTDSRNPGASDLPMAH
jgi:hypothetical protein